MKLFIEELSRLMEKHKVMFFVTNSKELKKQRSSLYVSSPGNVDIELGYIIDPTMLKGMLDDN